VNDGPRKWVADYDELRTHLTNFRWKRTGEIGQRWKYIEPTFEDSYAILCDHVSEVDIEPSKNMMCFYYYSRGNCWILDEQFC